MEDPKKRMEELYALIEYHSNRYYNDRKKDIAYIMKEISDESHL